MVLTVSWMFSFEGETRTDLYPHPFSCVVYCEVEGINKVVKCN